MDTSFDLVDFMKAIVNDKNERPDQICIALKFPSELHEDVVHIRYSASSALFFSMMQSILPHLYEAGSIDEDVMEELCESFKEKTGKRLVMRIEEE